MQFLWVSDRREFGLDFLLVFVEPELPLAQVRRKENPAGWFLAVFADIAVFEFLMKVLVVEVYVVGVPGEAGAMCSRSSS